MTMETEQSEQMEEVPVFQFQNNNLSNSNQLTLCQATSSPPTDPWSRCKDVFGCLDELELKHKAFERVRSTEDSELDTSLIHQGPSQEDMETINPDHPQFKHPASFSGRDYHSNKKGGRHGHESAGSHQQDFKKPSPPPNPGRSRQPYRGRFGRGRGVPDYKLNPDRYTEYSLEDVDTSDASNKQAAFQFLQERKALREGGLNEEMVDVDSHACSKGQITFKRPSKDKSSDKLKTIELEGQSSSTQNVASIDKMEADEELGDTNIEMDEIAGGHSKNESRSVESMDMGKLKRKLDDANITDDNDEPAITVSGEKPIGFKSRKVSKRNIRSRDRGDDENSD